MAYLNKEPAYKFNESTSASKLLSMMTHSLSLHPFHFFRRYFIQVISSLNMKNVIPLSTTTKYPKTKQGGIWDLSLGEQPQHSTGTCHQRRQQKIGHMNHSTARPIRSRNSGRSIRSSRDYFNSISGRNVRRG